MASRHLSATLRGMLEESEHGFQSGVQAGGGGPHDGGRLLMPGDSISFSCLVIGTGFLGNLGTGYTSAPGLGGSFSLG